MATEQTFREQYAIDVRTRCEVIGISSKEKTVDLKNHVTGEVTTEKYNKLVLSPGAAPIRPPLPGIDLPGIFSVEPCQMPGTSASGLTGMQWSDLECTLTQDTRRSCLRSVRW